MRAIFCVRGKPNLHGYRIREFVYDPARDLYVWQGRELEPDEFNARSREIVEANAEIRPFVLLVEGEPRAVEPRIQYVTPPEVATELERLRAEAKTLRAALGAPKGNKRRKDAAAA